MKPMRALLLGVDSARGLISSLGSTWKTEGVEEIQFTQEVLPLCTESDYASMLLRTFTRCLPELIVLCAPEQGRSETEAVLRAMQRNPWKAPVFIVVESGRTEEIFAALRLGAVDFAVPPFRSCDLIPRLRRLRDNGSERNVAAGQLKEELGLTQFIGESPAFMEAIKSIPKLARCSATVLITGETGTGKEMIARAVHYLGPRSGGPFIPVNCGAIPSELVENELFGHERGAFTGATSAASGLIHGANGGTIFLDEIDSLPLCAQVKLLRFLQDQEYRPIGSPTLRKADVRVLSASNANLEDAVRAGKFRSDLYFRINVLNLALPPLRERREDIPLLARHFFARYSQELADSGGHLSQAAVQKLECHDWPGNVRELENVIQRAVVMAEQPIIRAADIIMSGPARPPDETSFKAQKARLIVNFERSYLQRLLADHDGNITRAARAADKNRRAFWQLLRKHKITLPPAALNVRSQADNVRLR